jgi:hypothetical protein
MSFERWSAVAPSRFGKLGEYGGLEFRSCLEIPAEAPAALVKLG